MKKNCVAVLLTMLVMTLTGCGSIQVQLPAVQSQKSEEASKPAASGKTEEPSKPVASGEKKDSGRAIFGFDTSKDSGQESDDEIGLKNIKYDMSQDLTDRERLIAEYFNKDYMFVNSIEALQRYNKIFDGARIQFYAYVNKVIAYEGDSYKLLVCLYNNSEEFGDGDYSYMYPERYMILHGQTTDSRLIVGDKIQVNGIYEGVITESVDGNSYTIPSINVAKAYLCDPNDPYAYWYVEQPSRFSVSDVKTIAKSIFGEDITIRKDELDKDYDVELGERPSNYTGPCYVCELDNQSNAKFSKYFFNERLGIMTDAAHPNYEISFSGDFKHFYLFMYDEALESLTLEYYDNEFNKIWKREFEETTSATYDVTEDNIYLVANNELYVISTENGEDRYEKLYIGNKLDVRKFKEGVLAISQNKSDAFMFISPENQILWKVDALGDIETYPDIQTQMVDGKIIISYTDADYYSYEGSGIAWKRCYTVIDVNDGTVIYEGEVVSEEFQQYG